jgi:hypothetical protein
MLEYQRKHDIQRNKGKGYNRLLVMIYANSEYRVISLECLIKTKNYKPRILYIAEIHVKDEGEIKDFKRQIKIKRT